MSITRSRRVLIPLVVAAAALAFAVAPSSLIDPVTAAATPLFEGTSDLAVPAAASNPPVPSESVPAQGSTEICEKFGSTGVANDRYEVQNNVWGSEEPQCVRAFDTGFTVTKGAHHNASGPASYPSIFTGCHYGTCTAGTRLPRPIRELGSLTSTWIYQGPSEGTWVAAYDIWFDPTPRTHDTVTGTEMMIWLRTTGPAPIGERTGTVTIAGTTWQVWRGENGAQVVSYVREQPVDRVDGLDLMAFVRDAQARGALDPAAYLTSVQAGFEPWSGPPGHTTTAFSVEGVAEGGPEPVPAAQPGPASPTSPAAPQPRSAVRAPSTIPPA